MVLFTAYSCRIEGIGGGRRKRERIRRRKRELSWRRIRKK
jgi:hypothetical protein